MSTRLVRFSFTVLFVATALSAASAQLPGLGGGNGKSDEHEQKKAVPAERATARATMRTFIDSIVAASNQNDPALLDTAVACLDLSDVPGGLRKSAGRDLAIKLKEVIDRIRFIDFDEVPNDPTGQAYVFHNEPALNAAIVIAPTPDGEWLFTSATVASIEELYRHYSTMAKVQGVGGSGLEMSPSLWMRSKMPPELYEKAFLLEHWQWLGLLVLIVLGWIIGRITRLIVQGPVQRLLERRDWTVPREKIQRLLQPAGFVATAVWWWIGLGFLGLPAGMQVVALLVVKFMVAFGVVRTAFRMIDIITWNLAQKAAQTVSRFDDLLVPFFDKTAKVLVVGIGIVFIADVLGISPTSLLAGLGIGGLALALAAQETVKNLFGSLTVLLDSPFEIGDDIKLGDITGTVEEVGLRSTRVRTWDHTLVTIPNGNLISANVDNLGRRKARRYNATISIEYSTPPERVHAFCMGIRELVLQHPQTRKDSINVGLYDLGASSLDILFICHFTVTSLADVVVARHRLLLEVVTLAKRLGVEFAFPTRTLHMLPVDPDKKSGPGVIQDAKSLDAAEQFGKAEAVAIAQTMVLPEIIPATPPNGPGAQAPKV